MKLIQKYQFGSTLNTSQQNDSEMEYLRQLGEDPNFTSDDALNLLEASKETKYTRPKARLVSRKYRQIIKNDILGRRELFKDDSQKTEENLKKANQIVENLEYYKYPNNVISRVAKNATGLTTPDGTIIINENNKKHAGRTLLHEVEHKFQDIVPLSEFQQGILMDAYGDDFLEAQRKYDPDYGETGNFEIEMGPHAIGARSTYLMQNYPQLLGGGYEKQFDVVNKVKPEDIIKYTEETDGYGSNYIKYLRDKYKDDPEKLQQVLKDKAEKIRRAWLYVENTRQKENNTSSFT